MKISKNRTMASLIALFLTLAIAASLVAVLPTAQAQEAESWRSFVYVGVSPNTIGAGQDVIIVAWTRDMPPEMGEERGLLDSPTGRAGWYDMTVTITKPDNTTETLEFPYSDPVGANWITYTPTDVGTYTVQANFPGTWKNGTYYPFFGPPYELRRYYEPDVSDPVELVVQDEPIQPWQETPLPTGYWMRPINTANRDWHVLAGNWLGGAANVWPPGSAGGPMGWFGPSSGSNTEEFAYGLGTETPHILWTKQYWSGGLMDERYGATGYQTAHYQGYALRSPIILDGKIHYTPRYTAYVEQGWAIVDLYTGETLYLNYSDTRPSFGQVYNYEAPNQHGGFPTLWRTSGVTLPEVVQVPQAEPDAEDIRRLPVPTGPVQTINRTETPIRTGTVWEMLDGFTGATVCYIANVSSSGTQVYGKDGSILQYNTVNLGTPAAPNYYLQMWNTSHGTMLGGQTGTNAWQWRPQGGVFGWGGYLGGTAFNYVHDGRDFYSLNVSIPSMLGPRNARSNQTGSLLAIREGEYVIIGTTGVNDEQGIAPAWMMGLSLERDEEGTKLWEVKFTPPSSADRETVSFTGVYPEDGVILFQSSTSQKRWGYSLETGDLLWEGEPETQFAYYGMGQNVYEGILYSYGYGGVIYAYNITTGEVLWTYEATTEGFESAYGGNYPIGVNIIADGKLYTVGSEHSPTQPLWRGPNLRCIDAETGEDVWKILFWGAQMSPTESNILMADGILVGLNYFDGQIYAFGRGSSATTVTASPKTTVHGTTVVIEGTVTDDTATGRRNINDVLEFSLKGTPAISDEDMSAWMEYKFMQQAYPADAKGVEVVLETLDPNGNFYEIGRTTSDITGAYGVTWEPPVPGDYQIIATFAGSASYGSSQAITYMSVAAAPDPTPGPTPTPAPMTDMYVLGIGAGAIIAIIVIGLILILMMRKR